VSDSTHILGILTANQQISYRQHAHATKRTEGAQEDWRTGGFAFNNASFAEVARMLKNRYGLQVTYNAASVATFRFNFRISKQTSAIEMLEMLKDISGLAYTLDKNKVTIH
jgi:ferric-dicitrate binding protein FerR (iron transport regulator)